MKILVCPDSLKESLTAQKACMAIERGIRKVMPQADIVSIPLADGGEGTVQCLIRATGGNLVKARVHDPLMRPMEAFYGVMGDNQTAVIEMAAASGLELLKKEERNPLHTTTFGTGELIKQALDGGYKKIIVGLGGSATNDGGAGMAMALGARLLDSSDAPIPLGGKGIEMLSKIDLSGMDPRLNDTTITIASDVTNPLYGENGASRIFARQKGASDEMIRLLDNNLQHFSTVIRTNAGIDVGAVAGGGAAGGLGAGLIAFCKAKIQPGFPLIAELIHFSSYVQQADLVITAEGKTDIQTLSGKVPFGVAKMAQKFRKPLVVFTGIIGEGSEALYAHGVSSIFCICDKPMELEEAKQRAEDLLASTTERIIRVYLHG